MATKELAVSLNGMRVGQLERRPHGVLRSTYAQDWLAREFATPLSLPLAREPYLGAQLEHYLDPYIARGELARQAVKLAMAVLGKNRHYRWGEITRRHWLCTAEAAHLAPGLAESILAKLRLAVPDVIAQVQAQPPRTLPTSTSEPIFEGLARTARGL